MAPKTRDNPNLKRRISSLQLTLEEFVPVGPQRRDQPDLEYVFYILKGKLHPLYPQPEGPPHPKFPKTIMQWLLLTEDELDSIADYYDQITPTQFTNAYPAPMHWDKDFLARPEQASPQLMPWDAQWLKQHGWIRRSSLARSPSEVTLSGSTAAEHSTSPHRHVDTPIPSPMARHQHQRHEPVLESSTESLNFPMLPPPLTTVERVNIKRRKLGKFMGLRGCETPIEEMERRIWFLEARLLQRLKNAIESNDSARDGWGSPRGPSFGKGML